MLIFLPIVLLILVQGVLGFLVRYRPDYRSFWLVNLSGPLLAWLSLLFLWAELPLRHSMTYWHLSTGPNFDLVWSLDAKSWPLLFGIASLLFAYYLSNVRTLSERSVSTWLPGAAIVASSLFAVISGNLLTLLLSWMLLDLLVLVYHLSTDQEPESIRRSMNSFAATLVGNMLLLWAIAAYSGPSGLPIDQFPPDIYLLLIMSAGIRLGVLPLNPFVLVSSESSRGSSIHIRLAQVAASMALLVRIESSLTEFAFPLTALVLVATLFGSVKYLSAKSADDTLSYWIVTLAGFVLVAAINGQSGAALSWTLVLILGGTYLFLSRVQPLNRWVTLLWGLSLLSVFPFGPNFAGSAILTYSGSVLSYAFFIPASLMVIAWSRKALNSSIESVILERWEAILNRSGMAFLILSHISLGLGLAPVLKLSPTLLSVWPFFALLVLAAALWVPTGRPVQFTSKQAANIEEVFSFRWFYRWGDFVLKQAAAILRFTGSLLEGRAGVLWALLLVALLLSLISQLNPS